LLSHKHTLSLEFIKSRKGLESVTEGGVGRRPTLWDREELSQFKVAMVGEREKEREFKLLDRKMNVTLSKSLVP